MRRRLDVLVSSSYNWEMQPGPEWQGLISFEKRASDWGMGRLRRRLLKTREALSLARRARRHRALVALSMGPELGVLAVLTRVLAPRPRLVAAEPLLPVDPGPAL